MRFASPQFLWLLLVLPPALLLFLWWTARRKETLLGRFIEPRLLADLLAGVSPTRRRVRAALLVTGIVCLIFTLARPQWGFELEEITRRGLDIVVAIDTSKSMLAEDIAPNRLARAKLAALDLMQQAKADRLGLVAFAGNAFMQCPLTIDDIAFQQCVEALNVNIIPQGGTAIAEAIETAAKTFKYEADNYKVLVILTDGEDHDPRAVEAATQAAKAGMKIFTVGIGTTEGDLLRVKEADGRTDYVHDEAGNVVKSRLNEPLLQQIATAGNGFYLPLRGAKTVEILYERGLAPLPKTEGQVKTVKRWHERFQWPLATAILLLIAEMLFPERRRASHQAQDRTSPESLRAAPPEAGTPNAVAAILTVVLTLFFAPLTADASPSQALRDYRSGRYDDALKEYQRLIGKKKDDPRLNFNAGAAAYRDGQFESAGRHFGDVLSAPDLALQQNAYYNLGNTFYRLGDREQELDKKRETWERSLKEYDSALKLGPKDEDAKFNYEFVKKRLEELKQQQQQQQRKDKNRDQQQQQQAQNNQQDQQKQDQQKQQAENQSGQQKDHQKQQPEQAQSSADQQKEKSSDQQREQQDAEARGVQPMTPQQARQLLDAQKAEEAMLPVEPEGRPEKGGRAFKDW